MTTVFPRIERVLDARVSYDFFPTVLYRTLNDLGQLLTDFYMITYYHCNVMFRLPLVYATNVQ